MFRLFPEPLRKRLSSRILPDPGLLALLFSFRGGALRRKPQMRLRLFECFDGRLDVDTSVFLFERIHAFVSRRSDGGRKVLGGETHVEGSLFLPALADHWSARGLCGFDRLRRGGFSRRRGRWNSIQERFDLGQQLLRVKGLRDDGLRTDTLRPLAVERLERSREQNNRNASRRGISLDHLANLVAVLFRHDDVSQDEVGTLLAKLLQRLLPVRDADEVVVAVGERQLHDLLDREAIVREKNFLAHGFKLQRLKKLHVVGKSVNWRPTRCRNPQRITRSRPWLKCRLASRLCLPTPPPGISPEAGAQ